MSYNREEFLEKAKQDRELLKQDPYMPAYHYTSRWTWLNDPNGLCYWKGNWHLFYQEKMKEGEPDSYIVWGHTYSSDGIHWQEMPTAIGPGVEPSCWSGAAMVDGDRVIASYYGLDTGIMLAVSDDPLLENWTKLNDGNPVIPVASTPEEKAKYEIFDPCIWKKGDKYYIISGRFTIDPVSGKRAREGFLFESSDLIHWTYLHPFLEHDNLSSYGEDLACPYFAPLEDKHVLIHYCHRSGPKYIVGNYDTENDKFRVTGGAALTSSVSCLGGLHAPAWFPENEKSLRAIFNINFGPRTKTLNQVMSLPRSVSFANEEKTLLAFRPVDEAVSLRIPESHVAVGETELAANVEFIPEGIKGNCSEFLFEFEAKNIPAVVIKVLRSENAEEHTNINFYRQRGNRLFKEKSHESVVVLDSTFSSLGDAPTRRMPEMQSGYIAPDENLKVRVFVDKSVVEVFVNDKLATCIRVYPTREDSVGVSITPVGRPIKLLSCEKYDMESIF